MLVIGLTGGMGSGKSEVSRLFAQQGVPIIDTDEIAHQISVPGSSVLSLIAGWLGPGILQANGTLDRRSLRTLIFSDPASRQKLESILHPLILEEVLGQLHAQQSIAQPSHYVILVVPLLVECPQFLDLVDHVLLVDCPEGVQRERVLKRSQLQPEQINAIIAAQTSRARRLSLADDVIDNTGSLSDLEKHVSRLHQKWSVLHMLATDVN